MKRSYDTRPSNLWNKMPDVGRKPTDDEATELIMNLKFICVRHRLLADIPGSTTAIRCPVANELL